MVDSKKIWLASPHMSEEGYEQKFIEEAFKSNWIAPLGPNVNQFEKEISKKIGTKNATAVISGTSAIHLALKVLNIKEDDIVLCSSLTFSASANPILYEKAVPVFIDCKKNSWNIDPNYIREAILKYGNKIKAIIIVHLYGFSADMDEIMEISKEYNIPVIEDAAESLGGYYKGKHTGTFGDIGIFSFNGNKIITTSGGGMFVSENKKYTDKALYLSTQSRDQARHYQHSEIGYNYRMSNVVAGIGRGQLKVLDKRVEKKKYIYSYYEKKLKHLEGIRFLPISSFDSPNFWLSVVLLEGKLRPIEIIEALETENIESRRVWKPMHLQPIFNSYDYIGDENSNYLFENGICLPSDTKMTDEELEKVCNVLIEMW